MMERDRPGQSQSLSDSTLMNQVSSQHHSTAGVLSAVLRESLSTSTLSSTLTTHRHHMEREQENHTSQTNLTEELPSVPSHQATHPSWLATVQAFFHTN